MINQTKTPNWESFLGRPQGQPVNISFLLLITGVQFGYDNLTF